MTRLNWHQNERTFETGLDRGVLYPKNSPAVPWNGLTGVEEDGAEESQTYYLDGRPYLNLPKPKEFSATLKAYTYPDELSSIMGTVEATDGMYLDSQQGDSFNLCYRTIVGNGSSGEEAGYKIHLIYNAVVTPDGISYTTIGSSIEPTEFSWAIKAVPVSLSGFRSTAHIIIDTRHLSSTKISQIESLLYGTASTLASLPSPEVLYETMNFNDDIVVIDNGDGTWSAEGSYKNIYMISDGSFQIDNVLATNDVSNGTYIFGTGTLPISDGGTPYSIASQELDGGDPTTTGEPSSDSGSL